MTRHLGRKARAVPESPFVALTAGNNSVMEAMTRGAEACAKAGFLYQDELMRFATSRLEWDSKILQALLACKTWAEIAEIQRDWAATTAQDYLDEVSHLIQLTSKIAAPWMAPSAEDAEPAKTIEAVRRA